MARAQVLAGLRHRLAIAGTLAHAADAPLLPLGCAEVDALLGGGLALHALHELLPAHPHAHAHAAAFAARLAGMAAAGGGVVLWAGRIHDLFPPGLDRAGLGPGRLLLARADRDPAVLAAMEEGMEGMAAVVGEIARPGPWLMAASRRLQLRAARSGTLALLLHRTRPSARIPTAAMTVWELAPAPAPPPPVRPLFSGVGGAGLGPPRLALTLARARGAAAMRLPRTFLLEPRHVQESHAPHPFAVVAPLADGPADAHPLAGARAA